LNNHLICPSEVNRFPPVNNNQAAVGRLNYRGNFGRHGITNRNNDGVFQIERNLPFAWRKDNTKWGLLTSEIMDGLSNTAAMSERALGDERPSVFNLKGDWVDDSTGGALPNILNNPTDNNTLALRTACLANTSTTDANSNGGENWFTATYLRSLYNHVIPPNKKSVKAAANFEGCHPATSYHPAGVNTLMSDGSTRFVRDTISADVWAAVGGRKDGLAFNPANL
jgi:hypothetical protein